MNVAEIVGPTPIQAAVTSEDARWLTLCVYQEARGEPDDGKAAVAKVVLNRAQRAPPYASDGTIKGTIFWPNQFSWTSWAMLGGHYIKVARSPAEVSARAETLCAASVADRPNWQSCCDITLAVLNNAYHGGDGYQALGDEAVLYVNLAVARPDWADPTKLICRIGAHSFFRP